MWTRCKRKKFFKRGKYFYQGKCFAFILVLLTVELAFGKSQDLTTLSLEELMSVEVDIVQSASKYEQKVTEAPAAVTIVTAEEIKKYGYRNLAEILRSVRGFFVTSDRNYSYLGIRGFGRPGDYNSRILLLIDGLRFNDNIYEGALIGNEFILDVDLIERIEVVRGPASALYGTNAFFGIVNVITKQAKSVGNLEVSGEGGSLATYKGRLSLGHQFKNELDVLLSTSYFDSQGQLSLYYKEFDDPATNFGRAEKVDNDRYYSFFSKVTHPSIQFAGAHISREKVIPTASFGTVFNSPQNKTMDEYSYLSLRFRRDLRPELEFSGRIYYNQYRYRGDYLYDRLGSQVPEDYVLNKDFAWGSWWGGEGQVKKKLWGKNQIILGADYRENLRQEQENYDETPNYKYLDDRRNSKIWGVYFHGEVFFLDNLKLSAGIRYDHYETFGDTTNPRLALIYNFQEKAIFKLIYGTAFRAPNVFESYYHDGNITTKANPHLRPEEIETYEFVWEQYLTKSLRLMASGYYYKIKNLISQEIDPQDGLLVYNNVEEVDAHGIEIEMEGKWPKFLNGHISYSYQESENTKDKRMLTNSPRHLLKINLSIPLFSQRLWLGIEEQFIDKRLTRSGEKAEAYWLTNLTFFSNKIYKNLEVSLSIYNLFDQKYSDPGAAEHVQDLIEQDGRTFRAKLTYKF